MSVRGILQLIRVLLNQFEGLGAMTEWRDIVEIVVDRFSLRKPAVELGGS